MIHLLKFFLNSIHWFGLIWKEKQCQQYFKIFELDMRRVVERQYSLTQLFCVASHCMKIDTKTAG